MGVDPVKPRRRLPGAPDPEPGKPPVTKPGEQGDELGGDAVPGRDEDREELPVAGFSAKAKRCFRVVRQRAWRPVRPELGLLPPRRGVVPVDKTVHDNVRLRLLAEAFRQGSLDAAGNRGQSDRKVKRARHLEQPVQSRGVGDHIVVAPPECDGPPGLRCAAEHIVERGPVRGGFSGSGRFGGGCELLDNGNRLLRAFEVDARP